MKIIFTGAEYYLSDYLNAIKITLVLFVVITIIWTALNVIAGKDFEDMWLSKHRVLFAIISFLVSVYSFLWWK